MIRMTLLLGEYAKTSVFPHIQVSEIMSVGIGLGKSGMDGVESEVRVSE